MKIKYALVGGFGATLVAVFGVVLLSLIMLTQLTTQWREISTVVAKRQQLMLRTSLYLGYAILHFNNHLHEGGNNEIERFNIEMQAVSESLNAYDTSGTLDEVEQRLLINAQEFVAYFQDDMRKIIALRASGMEWADLRFSVQSENDKMLALVIRKLTDINTQRTAAATEKIDHQFHLSRVGLLLAALTAALGVIVVGVLSTRAIVRNDRERSRAIESMHAEIDERRKAEAELKRYRDQLEQLVEERTNLVEQRTRQLEQRTVELQHQQTFLQAVLENISDGIVACDAHGKLSFFNRASREMHGVEQEELPPDQWVIPYQHYRADGTTPMSAEDVPLFRAFQGETFHNEQIVIVQTGGQRCFLLASGQAMFDRHHAKIGAVISLHDITEQKIAETHLIAAKEAAEAANRAKSSFLANMSHELRTPLNAILGFSDILRQSPNLTEAQKQNLGIIHKSGDYLLGLINDVLDLSKIDAGLIQLNNAPFDALSMILGAVEMMQGRALEKGLQLRVDQSPDFPRHIIGDETKLRQIVINLLSNAVKATKQGCVILHLGVQGQAEYLVLEVEDTGSGIASDYLAKIFTAFYQVESFGNQQGTGLGLTITQQFVALMGGRLTVASTLGKGSTFRVELPLQLAGPEYLPEERRESGKVLELEPGQPKYRVLVVDDQLENRLLLAQLLEKVGFIVQLAEDGAEAVARFQSWRPRFVWMDQRMPVMDGAEATRRIRVLPGGEKVKIVAVTASVFEQEDTTLLQAGFDAIVHKPYLSEQIYDIMASLLGVRYIYASPEASAPLPSELSSQALAALPVSLRHAFAEALTTLDVERIETLVAEISAIDAALAASINLLVENYNYQPIVNVLDDLPLAPPLGIEANEISG
ncbi:MAG: response regulator [Desulfobulbaceae bacterium]|nr:response regulator [Desulfobulbaceae bacterium]